MLDFLSVVYGLHMVALIYLITYLAVRGTLGTGAIPFFVVIGKYLIYWKLVTFGFQHLTTWGILSGFIGGLYLSLPLLYWVNQKFSFSPSEKRKSEAPSPTSIASSA